MTEQGVDFAYGRPGATALAQAGKTFVCRYVPYQGDGGKGLTVEEVTDYHANGIAICLVFESTAGRPLGGRLNGLVDGALARQGARSVGWPADRPIYFAMDQDVTAVDFPAIDAYLAACAESVKVVGIYGEYEVIEHCHSAGTATYFWQARAWSGGKVSPWRHIYQYLNGQTLNGAGVDLDDGEGDDFGQWKPEEEGMTPEQVDAAISAKLDEALGPGFLALLEQMLGIQPSTFSGDYQKRADAIVAALHTALPKGTKLEVI